MCSRVDTDRSSINSRTLGRGENRRPEQPLGSYRPPKRSTAFCFFSRLESPNAVGESCGTNPDVVGNRAVATFRQVMARREAARPRGAFSPSPHPHLTPGGSVPPPRHMGGRGETLSKSKSPADGRTDRWTTPSQRRVAGPGDAWNGGREAAGSETLKAAHEFVYSKKSLLRRL